MEPNGPIALLYNHGALANIPLANKMAFVHLQLCMNYYRVHQRSCFCLHSPCRILLSPTLLQSKKEISRKLTDIHYRISWCKLQKGDPSSRPPLGWNLLIWKVFSGKLSARRIKCKNLIYFFIWFSLMNSLLSSTRDILHGTHTSLHQLKYNKK